MQMLPCCGPRREPHAPQQCRPDRATAAAARAGHSATVRAGKERSFQEVVRRSLTTATARSPGSGATLIVKVQQGEKLMGMDTRINPMRFALETTLDAYVRLAINDGEPFGKTSVRWKSNGYPVWDETFEVEVSQPRSFLCIFVCDDDDIFRQDGPLLSLQRKCGFVEVPLWELPRNRVLSGWFTLNHPDIVDRDSNLAGQNKAIQAREQLQKSAGRLKITLTMRTTALQEIMGYMKPAPVFEESLPPLDVPRFIENVFEVKRLIMERLIFVVISTVMYALSWESRLLSSSVLLWHWFVCCHPEYTWATIWFLALLCFWHKIPDQIPEQPPEAKSGEASTESHKRLSGFTYIARSVHGFYMMPINTICAVREEGIRGLSKQIEEATFEVKEGLKATGKTVQQMGSRLNTGISKKFQTIHGPGLAEFQQILQLKPALRDIVRSLQITAANTRKTLQTIDDLFYWASTRTTGIVVCVVFAAFVLSFVLCRIMIVVLAYGYFALGTFVILSNTSSMRLAVAIIAVCSKPKVPFQSYTWFELVRDAPC